VKQNIEYDLLMDMPPTRTGPPRWFWIAAIWCGIGLFDASQTVLTMRAMGMHHYWTRLFFTLLLSWLPWMFATPLVFRLGRRYPPAQWRSITTWMVHLGACAVIGLTYAAWVAMWESLLNPWAVSPGPDPFPRLWLHKFYGGLLSYAILYGVILLVARLSIRAKP
jgi:hypothetical protein